jgi:hypothetical protein
MINGELISLYATGFSLVVVLLFLVVLFSRTNDYWPLAKIRVKSDDRMRRSAPPAEENDAVQPQSLLAGLVLTILVVTAIVSILNNY